MKKSFHAGAFFEAIGDEFDTLEKSKTVINADVLDAWFDPSPKVIEKLKEHLPFILRTSPPNYSEGLLRTISRTRNINEKNILIGGGSSDLIFLLFQYLIQPKDRVLILDPMYGEYSHILETVLGADLHRTTLSKKNNFTIEMPSLINAINQINPKIVVLVNPNSPTGNFIPKNDILLLLNSIPKSVTVAIDETYIEYISSEASLEKEVQNYSNLIIIKSMSKVYALSGVRVGYLVAPEPLIESLSAFLPPWSVNLAGQIAAVEALNDPQYYQRMYDLTHAYRSDFSKTLSIIPTLKVYPSCANFFLVELLSNLKAQTVYETLKQRDIFIRNPDSMSKQFNGKFLRIAVKHPERNERIADAVRELCL